MDCQEAQSLLSAYHDGELSAEVRAAVAEHLGNCSRCREELAAFDRMSGMAKGLAALTPPQGIWAGIEASLDEDNAPATRKQEYSPTAPHRVARKWGFGIFVTAAVVLLASGIVWVASEWEHRSQHHQTVADLAQYVEHFTANPDTAQNILLAKFDGKPVDLAQATTLVGYRPAAAAGLPKGYSLEGMYVLKMPCCTCVQTICRREDGRRFAVFEHSEDQSVRCGDGQMTRAQCNGQSCALCQIRSTLVATWKSKQRQFTIVGAKDLKEVGDLITHFDAGASDT